jgi:hypothetical protein
MSLFIDEHRSVFGVEPICRALAVNTNRLRRTRGGSLSAEARGFFFGFPHHSRGNDEFVAFHTE